MPYAVRKKENSDKWECYNQDTGKVYGTFDTKAEAEDQLRALYANADPGNESRVIRVRMKNDRS